jgi:O-Antigen ligase
VALTMPGRTPVEAMRRQLVLALPGLLVVAGGLILAAMHGGFPPTAWYPAALFAVTLLMVAVIAAPPRRPGQRLTVVALGAYGLFAAWSYLSITWAAAPGEAWDAANRTLLYGVALAIVALRPWGLWPAWVAVGLMGFGIAALATGVLIVGVSTGEPANLFYEGRLAEPTGYVNATANLWLVGYFPALHLATGRAIAWPVRGLGLAAATALLQMELLSQSRGALIAFCVAAVTYLVFTPARWPALLALGTTVALTGLSFDMLVEVRESARAADLGSALDRAAVAMAWSAAAAVVLGLSAAAVGARLRPMLERRPGLKTVGDGALMLLGVAGAVTMLIAIGDPKTWAEQRWRDFKNSGYERIDVGRTRFAGGLGSGRYDYYRVTLKQFSEEPLRGVGGDNFAAAYLRERRTSEAPRHPHSVAFGVLSQHGLVGALLFAIFLGGLVAAGLRAARRATREGAGVVAAALASFLVFLIHSFVDWLWAFPGLAVLAFAMLGMAARIEDSAPGAPGRARWSVPARLFFGLIALTAAVSFALPGIAARYTSAAYDDFRVDPDKALARLGTSADLNPLSDEPLVAKGVLEQRLGRPRRALQPLREAISREPENWFAHLELGLALARLRDSDAAAASLGRARQLNPRQPLVAEVLRDVRRGRPVDPVAVERRLYEPLRRRLRPTDADAASE